MPRKSKKSKKANALAYGQGGQVGQTSVATRVRSKSGEEASLPHFGLPRRRPASRASVESDIGGGIDPKLRIGLDKPAAKLKSRGTSKSAASRHLVGSTENSRVCTAMLQDLLERGLRVDESILCVVDGGKGIRKALVDVLGDLAVIQRCQIHKLRNLRSYLPKSRHAYVLQTMKEAYKCKSADKARKRLQALVSWLERNGYDEAVGSLREGMEEVCKQVPGVRPTSAAYAGTGGDRGCTRGRSRPSAGVL